MIAAAGHLQCHGPAELHGVSGPVCSHDSSPVYNPFYNPLKGVQTTAQITSYPFSF